MLWANAFGSAQISSAEEGGAALQKAALKPAKWRNAQICIDVACGFRNRRRMAEEASVETDPAATAVAEATGTEPQPDWEEVSVDQLDTLFETGVLTLPVRPSGEGTVPPAKEVEAKAAPGDKPVAVEPAPPAKVEDEVVETRSAEEIEADVATARAAAVEAGLDEAAQEAAAAEAAAPKGEIEVKPEDEITGIQRPRLRNKVDQQIAAVFKAAEAAEMPISWAEAERRVKGDPPAKVEPVVVAPVAAPDFAGTVATLETEVADIKAKLTSAGADEGLFNAAISTLTIELADKTADLKLAQRDLRQAADQAAREAVSIKTASDAARAVAKAAAVERWPAAGDATTPLGKAVAARIAQLKDPKHPDHAILFADSAPLTIVRDVADELGIAPVAKKAAPPVKPKVEAPPRKVVSPAPGNKTAVAPGKPAEDAKRTEAYLTGPDATLQEMDAAQGMPTELAHAVR
jgi:hypothetical protein